MSERIAPRVATNAEIVRWEADAAHLKIVRPSRGTYITDDAVVAKVRTLIARIRAADALIDSLDTAVETGSLTHHEAAEDALDAYRKAAGKETDGR